MLHLGYDLHLRSYQKHSLRIYINDHFEIMTINTEMDYIHTQVR